MVHLSEGRFSHEFKRFQGIPFRKARLLAKLQQSLDFLLNTSLPIAKIAETVGYAETGKFYKAFRSVYGISPSEFRGANGRPDEQLPMAG